MKTEIENFKVVRRQFEKFGTEVDLQILLEDGGDIIAAQQILELAEEKLCEFEKIFSRFDDESELSNLNSRVGEFVSVSWQMQKIAKLSLHYWEKTCGYLIQESLKFWSA